MTAKLCPHISVNREDHDTGDITYGIMGFRNFDPDCRWGEIARVYTTREDAEALADGLRKQTKLCWKCKEEEKRE